MNTDQPIKYEDLTELEKDVLIDGIVNNEYGDSPKHWIWAWAIQETSNTQIVKVKQISGVVSSLVKKGLVVTEDGETHDEDSLYLTEKAQKLVKEYFISIGEEDEKYY